MGCKAALVFVSWEAVMIACIFLDGYVGCSIDLLKVLLRNIVVL